MMIVMKETATDDGGGGGRRKIERAGARAHRSKGARVTVIGAIGDVEQDATSSVSGSRASPASTGSCRSSSPTSSPPRSSPTASERDRHRGPQDRRRSLRADRRAVHGRVARADAADRAAVKDAGATLLRGGAYKPRTSPYAFQGLGAGGAAAARRGQGRDRPADRHRADGHARHRRRARGRRRRADRRAQHAELPAALRGRPLRAPGAAQARALLDARRAADGRRVHPQGRQPAT